MQPPHRQQTFSLSGVRFHITDTSGADVLQRLEGFTAEGGAGREGEKEVSFVVEPWQAAWGSSGPGFRVMRDGKLCYLGRSVQHLTRWLRNEVEEQISRRSMSSILVPADAMRCQGQAILFLRRSSSSHSSTLRAALIRCGAEFTCDDLVRIDAAGLVRAMAQNTGGVRVALVVVAIQHPGAYWRPQVLRGARAVLPIVDTALAHRSPTDRDATRAVLRVAACLARTVATLHGAYSDASVAAPSIFASLNELLDPQQQRDVVRRRRRILVSHARNILAGQGISGTV